MNINYAEAAAILTFIALVEFVIAVPLIVYCLYGIYENTNSKRNQFQPPENRIADELEKLRLSLNEKREHDKGQ